MARCQYVESERFAVALRPVDRQGHGGTPLPIHGMAIGTHDRTEEAYGYLVVWDDLVCSYENLSSSLTELD